MRLFLLLSTSFLICCQSDPAQNTVCQKGDQGEQGIQGPKGDVGLQGLRGPKGDQGPPLSGILLKDSKDNKVDVVFDSAGGIFLDHAGYSWRILSPPANANNSPSYIVDPMFYVSSLLYDQYNCLGNMTLATLQNNAYNLPALMIGGVSIGLWWQSPQMNGGVDNMDTFFVIEKNYNIIDMNMKSVQDQNGCTNIPAQYDPDITSVIDPAYVNKAIRPAVPGIPPYHFDTQY